ncbi:MAG: Ni/Co efflux regulator RcnB [Halieaceae bacterium]|jgi:Ni/Co efflux regulator RcnB
MKKLIVYAMATLMLTATGSALAERRHQDGQKKHHSGKYYQGKQHGNYSRHDYQQGYRHGYRSNYGHYGHKPYSYRRHGYYNRNYYPSYLGAALFGSALTYSLYHTHNGSQCYENHGNNSNYGGVSYSGSNTQVVGCHRLERLPDGSERRVEVPLSQCN